jgi:hypothetical protein
MAGEQRDQSASLSLSERVGRYRQEVEKVVQDVGEHPLYELKRSCDFAKLADKIEFVKDVQSICTSRIESERYLVVGADDATHSFVGVDNLPDFDEVKIRQRLEKYLQPTPRFEVFNVKAPNGKDYVLFVFPRQTSRRILARETVDDSSGMVPKLLLRKGDLWTKGDSTGKRLATSADWDEIYEEHIELETEKRTRQRTAHFLDQVTAQEKLGNRHGLESVPVASSDEEFKALIESLCVSGDRRRFGIVLERLRDDLVEGWHSIGAFGPENDPNLVSSTLPERVSRVRDHKTNVFIPAIQRLVAAAIYVVKNAGPVDFVGMVMQLLDEIYESAGRLSNLLWLSPRGLMSASSTEHVSHTVPALESLIALHLIGAYIAKRRRFEYLRTLLRMVVRPVGVDGGTPTAHPMAFWPLRSGWGEPQALRFRDGRIKVCAERVKGDPALIKTFGSETAATEALCEYEFLLELNSYLAVDTENTSETVAFMKKHYPNIDFSFWASLVAFPLENVAQLAMKLLAAVNERNVAVLKEVLFEEHLAPFLVKDGNEIFLKLLRQLDNDRNRLLMELRRFHFGTSWPKEIAQGLEGLGNARAQRSG